MGQRRLRIHAAGTAGLVPADRQWSGRGRLHGPQPAHTIPTTEPADRRGLLDAPGRTVSCAITFIKLYAHNGRYALGLTQPQAGSEKLSIDSTQHSDLILQRMRGRCRFFNECGVLLRDLIHLDHRPVHLFNTGALFAAKRGLISSRISFTRRTDCTISAHRRAPRSTRATRLTSTVCVDVSISA